MIFRSKYKELRMVLVATRKREVNGEVFWKPGVLVEFKDFAYSTEDEEIISLLKGAKGYGKIFFSTDAGADTPTKETLRDENAKREFSEGIGLTCRECGFVAKNEFGLTSHSRTHKKGE